MSKERHLALVTGASAGIGEALASELAASGYDLVLVARRTGKLRSVAKRLQDKYGIEAHVRTTDLLEPGAAARLARRLEREGLAVDVLVNNAGLLEAGYFTAMDTAALQRMVQLNTGTLTDLLAQFVPPMQGRGSGHVMNVASIAAFQPVVGLAAYAASKAYVLSLGEALGEELRGSGVTVTTLCPGITDTSMIAHAADDAPGFGELPRVIIGSPEDVARAGVRGLLRGDPIVVPGVLNRASTLLADNLPRWLRRRLMGALARSRLGD
ncbi:MAG TPA: short-chain dehydrogenase [Halieaceae bacterium]|nr:short-chain dehydrogenase [Halieaceae bacterium]